MSLLLLTVTLRGRGGSNKHCLLLLFFFGFKNFRKKKKTRAGHSLYLPGDTVDPTWQAHICPSPPRARTHDRRIRRPTLSLTTEIMPFFRFRVNVKFLQWSFNRCLCLHGFGMKIAKQL